MTNPRDYAYDVETFKNCFTMTLKHIESGWRWIYEISDFENHAPQLVEMIYQLGGSKCRMVGFNNIAFDYPVLHFIVKTYEAQGFITPQQIHEKAMTLIYNSGNRFGNIIWPDQRICEQLDLFTIHHFDNWAKTTSLKELGFNMRSATIEDLPFDPNVPVMNDQVSEIIRYNAHDVEDTIQFYHHTWSMIAFREELTAKYGKDFINSNDTKIGKDFFIMQLEASGVPCYEKVMIQDDRTFEQRLISRRQPRQTRRRSIPLASVVFPYIGFHNPEFARVLTYLKATTITNTKAPPELDKLSATIRGFDFDFGTGGIHGSVKNTVVRADQDYELIDVDVKSYYPRIAIVNRVFPEHLSERFCDIYADLYNQRQGYPKKSSESAMLKLALNGVYGDSNNEFSAFLDPKYTMTITINGQLLLCMLTEKFLAVPEFEIVQINTDGMTFRVPRSMRQTFETICEQWQEFTRLELEYTYYDAMFIRDVNNYVAVGVDGKTKRKGAYQFDTSEPNNIAVSLGWSQDWSALVVCKAADAVMKGGDLVDFINRHDDPFDFMLRVKVKRSDRLIARYGPGQRPIHHPWAGPSGHIIGFEGQPALEEPLQNTTRYQIAKTGPYLFKIMGELARKPGSGERYMAVDKGWPVRICNRAADFDWSALDRSYYVKEAEKLLGMMPCKTVNYADDLFSPLTTPRFSG